MNTTRLSPSVLSTPSLALLVVAAAATGCAKKLDKLSVNRVVARALTVPDVNQSCEIGVSLRSPLAAATSPKHPARQALLITESTAAMCDEVTAWDYELEKARALSEPVGLDPLQRALAAKDAGIIAERYHQRAAARYIRAWEHGLVEFGDIGNSDECPKLKEYEEFAYFITLVAGIQSVLHDSQSGRTHNVPQETVLRVSRAAHCLQMDEDRDGVKDGIVDGKKFFYVPEALEAAAWAIVPGSGPAGVDPWAILEEVAEKGEKTGVRVARGLQVTLAMNAGMDDLARTIIAEHASSLSEVPTRSSHALLDRYAFLMSQFQSDLIWIAEEGYRTPVFGELPGSAPAGAEEDPFGSGGDPFGDDPFGGDAAPPAAPDSTGTDTLSQEPK